MCDLVDCTLMRTELQRESWPDKTVVAAIEEDRMNRPRIHSDCSYFLPSPNSSSSSS